MSVMAIGAALRQVIYYVRTQVRPVTERRSSVHWLKLGSKGDGETTSHAVPVSQNYVSPVVLRGVGGYHDENLRPETFSR